MSASVLSVSLESHLADTLRPLIPLLPDSLAAQLTDLLSPVTRHTLSDHTNAPEATPKPTPTVPYALLTAISTWSRSPTAQRALSAHAPPLRVQDYSMVALLAGTRTSPDKVFPNLVALNPADDTQSSRRREQGDRRAVTAVINALLSIAGSAIAVWWAADRLAWPNEWRVLLALLVAIIVATSEAILYVIWEDRRQKSSPFSRRPLHFRKASRPDAPTRLAEKKLHPDNPDSSPDVRKRPSELLQLQGPTPAVSTAMSARVSGTAQETLRERSATSRTKGQNQ